MSWVVDQRLKTKTKTKMAVEWHITWVVDQRLKTKTKWRSHGTLINGRCFRCKTRRSDRLLARPSCFLQFARRKPAARLVEHPRKPRRQHRKNHHQARGPRHQAQRRHQQRVRRHRRPPGRHHRLPRRTHPPLRVHKTLFHRTARPRHRRTPARLRLVLRACIIWLNTTVASFPGIVL